MHPDDDQNSKPKLAKVEALPLLRMDPATQRAVARTGKRPLCSCLDAQYTNNRWRELKLHRKEQDTTSDAWKRLLKIIERCASDGEEIFEPGAKFEWEDWIKITTLPATIAKLTRVKELRLYGSNLVCIPPEIGEMERIEKTETVRDVPGQPEVARCHHAPSGHRSVSQAVAQIRPRFTAK